MVHMEKDSAPRETDLSYDVRLDQVLQEYRGYSLEHLEGYTFGKNWSVAEDAGKFLGMYCRTFKPHHVVEFGTGLSTLIFGYEASLGNIERVWSVDSHPEPWGQCLREIEETLVERGWFDKVSLCEYPIRIRRYGQKFLQFYILPKSFWVNVGSLDLVFVDGPSSHYRGREAALYEVFPYLENGAKLLLDDAKRYRLEREWLSRWEQRYGRNLSIRVLDDFDKGLGVVNIRDKNLPLSPFPTIDIVKDVLFCLRFPTGAPSV